MSKWRKARHLHSIIVTFSIGWRERPLATSLYLLGAVIESGSFVAALYSSAKLASLLANYITSHETTDIWLWLWIDITCALGSAIGFWLMSWARRLIYFGIVQWSTRMYQETLCRLDIPDFYDDKVRNRINKVQAGYTWQMPNLNETVLDLMYALLRFIITAIVVADIAWWLIPIIVLFLIPTLLNERRLAFIQWFVWDEQGDDRHVFWGLDHMLRQAKNQMELRSSQAAGYIIQKLNTMTGNFYTRQQKQVNAGYVWMGPAKILESGSTILGAVIVLKQFLNGIIGLQQYFFLSGALLRINGALNTVFSTLTRLQEPLVFADDFYSLISSTSHITDLPDAVIIPSSIYAPEIEFQNVTFAYPKQKKTVLTNFNLKIKPGEHIAIVGKNGAGKSTLIKLLLRFYEPTSGKILIDGTDLKTIAIDSWYERLATLFQDFNQYPMNIRENIEIARPVHAGNKAKLDQATELANVKEIVEKYPYGMETVLDNSFAKGIEPSGGQWQRIALARTFYRDAPVLLLDEPTSAIDAKAEYDIFNNIFEQYQNRTVLIISHRFSTVRRADRIVVIDEGKIIEQGTHKELMLSNGLYKDMFTKQAEGYKL